MNRVRFIIWCCFLSAGLTLSAQFQERVFVDASASSDHMLPGHIIFKLTVAAADAAEVQHEITRTLQASVKNLGSASIRPVFPGHRSPVEKYHPSGHAMADLSRIYALSIDPHHDLNKVMEAIAATGQVEYVQPRYLPSTTMLGGDHSVEDVFPNDSLLHKQYYLKNIGAFKAWGVSRGDTCTVIGIVDTGIDLRHPDLVHAIHYNYDDPVNGEDSDGDGYVDNFYGWDLGENNNDPGYRHSAHGLHVAGIAGATANNHIGIAGVGYYSRILPVKVDDEYGRLTMAYEGIVYAADQGAAVINCSWGSHFHPGPFGQDIIDYAVFNRDALVVAAAGNARDDRPFYPASLAHTLSVAATDSLDRKAGFSSYGPFVDVVAPGAGIWSTWVNDGYMASGGTSMAAPVVAGAAAIIRSHFPHLDPLQVAALLKTSADPVCDLPGNENYAGMLGWGRVNLYAALTDPPHPYFMVTALLTPDDSLAFVRPSDPFRLDFDYHHIMGDADGMMAVLSSDSGHMLFPVDTLYLAAEYWDAGGIARVGFLVQAGEELPGNYGATFTLSFYDATGRLAGRKSFFRWLNRDYLNIETERLATTINARGGVGYNYPDYRQGMGFSWKRSYTLLQAAGLILADGGGQVADNVYGSGEGGFSEMMMADAPPMRWAEVPGASLMVSGRVRTDSVAVHGNALPVTVCYQAYFWDEPGDPEDFFVIRYQVTNPSNRTYKDLYAGFFADWVLRDKKQHRAAFYAPSRMGYAYSADGGRYAGIQLLSDGGMRHYAFDKHGLGGSIAIGDGFSDHQKYLALRSVRMEAGRHHEDNDIATLLSSGPFSLAPGDTIEIAFALHAADSMDDLIAQASLARIRYLGLSDVVTDVDQHPSWDVGSQMFAAYPVPLEQLLHLRLANHLQGEHRVLLIDMQGVVLLEKLVQANVGAGDVISLSVDTIPRGVYLLSLQGVSGRQVIRVWKP